MSRIRVTVNKGLSLAPRRPRLNNNDCEQENVSQYDRASWGQVVYDLLARRTRGMDGFLEARR